MGRSLQLGIRGVSNGECRQEQHFLHLSRVGFDLCMTPLTKITLCQILLGGRYGKISAINLKDSPPLEKSIVSSLLNLRRLRSTGSLFYSDTRFGAWRMNVCGISQSSCKDEKVTASNLVSKICSSLIRTSSPLSRSIWYRRYIYCMTHQCRLPLKEMDLGSKVQFLDVAVSVSLHFGKGMIHLILQPAINVLSTLCVATRRGEGKYLNLKVEWYCLGESVESWCTILLITVHPKSVAASTKVVIRRKKKAILVSSSIVYICHWTAGPELSEIDTRSHYWEQEN